MAAEPKDSKSSTSDIDTVALKILGVYPQKQGGFFMQRIKIPAGQISWVQWRKIAEISQLYSPATPLHVTTRQDIELHNIAGEDLTVVQRELTNRGLTIFAGGGDSVRNITACTHFGLYPGSFDLFPLVDFVMKYFEQDKLAQTLPRKFKISFSCPESCAKPYLNDLGFVVQTDGTFNVIGAGSLGPRPAIGIKLCNNLPVKDVLPFCMAAIELFHKYGDRQNRHKARLRHVRERFGDAAFCHQLNRYFARIKGSRPWPDLPLNPEDQNYKLLYRLRLPNGNILPQQAIALADAAQPQKARLRINIEHGLEIYGEESFALPPDLAALTENPVIIACPGASTCPRALANSYGAADKIREALKDVQHNGINISISGCPNNCAQSAVADIGLVGILRKVNGQSIEHYQVLVGGGNGKDNRLAQPYGVFPADQVADVIKKIVIEGVTRQNLKVLTQAQ